METPSRTMNAGLPLALWLVFVSGAFLRGEQSPATTPPLVNLNVTAVDIRGLPVPDLRAEDFQVLDKRQAAEDCHAAACTSQGPARDLSYSSTFSTRTSRHADSAQTKSCARSKSSNRPTTCTCTSDQRREDFRDSCRCAAGRAVRSQARSE